MERKKVRSSAWNGVCFQTTSTRVADKSTNSTINFFEIIKKTNVTATYDPGSMRNPTITREIDMINNAAQNSSPMHICHARFVFLRDLYRDNFYEKTRFFMKKWFNDLYGMQGSSSKCKIHTCTWNHYISQKLYYNF